jgi:hypothetical protein
MILTIRHFFVQLEYIFKNKIQPQFSIDAMLTANVDVATSTETNNDRVLSRHLEDLTQPCEYYQRVSNRFNLFYFPKSRCFSSDLYIYIFKIVNCELLRQNVS